MVFPGPVSTLTPHRALTSKLRREWIGVPPHSDPRAAACQNFGRDYAKLERFLTVMNYVKAS